MNEVFKGTVNIYKGFEIDTEDVPDSEDAFVKKMESSIARWKEECMEVFWLTIPESKSRLIPIALSYGFKFHHTQKDTLVLIKKMHEHAFVVPYASHYIGVGGVVIDDKNRLLVVREFYKNGTSVHYKLPGGTLEEHEHIEAGIIREVLEETGIKTVFQSLVCFRHRHRFRFDKSDIYMICLLKPLNHDIVRETEEIAEALWMDIDEYLSHEHVHALNKEIVRAALSGHHLYKKDVEGYPVDKNEYEIFLP
mgnify:CR=1 FL=1